MGDSPQDAVRVPGSVATRRNSKRDDVTVRDDTESPSKKAIWLWSKVKYQLVEFHALPEYLRDNDYILRHYRADWPLKHALLSIFSIHNETLNIWT